MYITHLYIVLSMVDTVVTQHETFCPRLHHKVEISSWGENTVLLSVMERMREPEI